MHCRSTQCQVRRAPVPEGLPQLQLDPGCARGRGSEILIPRVGYAVALVSFRRGGAESTASAEQGGAGQCMKGPGSEARPSTMILAKRRNFNGVFYVLELFCQDPGFRGARAANRVASLVARGRGSRKVAAVRGRVEVYARARSARHACARWGKRRFRATKAFPFSNPRNSSHIARRYWDRK